MNTLIAYAEQFFKTPAGQMVRQMVLSFLRVGAAAAVAAWIAAGTPLTPSGSQILDWAQVGVSAAVALVVANYIGPWEKRYGRK